MTTAWLPIHQQISSLPAFRGLAQDRAALEALARISRIRPYEAGQIILLEGEEGPVFFVLEGTVRIFRSNLEGREQTLAYLRKGESFNLPSAFADSPTAPASAMALTHTRTLLLPREALGEIILQFPSIALAFLKEMAQRLHHLSELVYDLSLLDVRARLARFLLAESRSASPVRWTHAQIASRIGTVRVVVSRTLAALAQEGVIRLNRHRIEILDAEALAKLAQLGPM